MLQFLRSNYLGINEKSLDLDILRLKYLPGKVTLVEKFLHKFSKLYSDTCSHSCLQFL